MIGLCSKTYVLQQTDCVKMSSKGLNRGTLSNPVQVFQNVLQQAESTSAINRGFRVRHDTIYTYQQDRCGISYFYCKRRVLDDGIHTVPLSITLCPWSERNQDIVKHSHPLWPDRNRVFELTFGVFHSLFAVCEYAFSQTNRDCLVKEALIILRKEYEPEGELVFVKEGNFGKWEYRKMANLWTCGAKARCASMIPCTKYPGLNALAELFLEVETN